MIMIIIIITTTAVVTIVMLHSDNETFIISVSKGCGDKPYL